MIVIHAALLVALQPHPPPAVTVTVPVVAAGVARFDPVGEMLMLHGAPACVTVNVCPPIVIVPVRDVADVFAVTLYATFPFPVPLAPTPIVIQASLLTAVQLQVAAAVTETLPLPAIDVVRFKDVGEIVVVHGSPACVTVNVCPPMITVPMRVVVLLFAATA